MWGGMKNNENNNNEDNGVSLDPLTLEDALKGAMEVKPEKEEESEEEDDS